MTLLHRIALARASAQVRRLEAKAMRGSDSAMNRLAYLETDEIGIARRQLAHEAIGRVKTRHLLAAMHGDSKLFRKPQSA